MASIHQKIVVADGTTPVGAYAALRSEAGDGSFLLESVAGGERWGRYSILGFRPRSHVVVHGREGADPFTELAQRIACDPTSNELDVAARFASSHVGLIAYDAVHYTTKVDPWPDNKDAVARLIGDATVIVFDNLTHMATIAGENLADVERAEAVLRKVAPLSPLPQPDTAALPGDVDVDIDDAGYEKNVERCKEYIRAGDAFQIVPARTFSTPSGSADPFDVYRALRVLSPAPYMYLLELPERADAPAVAIAGASPETLVRVEANQVFLRPIAGTRRRGRTPEEDDALAEEMLSDPKELAEHVMLIDLARNDIGRIAETNTVRVPLRMTVERYSHVMHIVSEVVGDVAGNRSPWDVLRATFPAGTLTGAPKVRAMQIIRELETRPRGAYGGALGYVSPGTDLDFAIAIRTVVMRDQRFEVTAGAGIVADSIPRLESKETRNKARAALAAIHAARSLRGQ